MGWCSVLALSAQYPPQSAPDQLSPAVPFTWDCSAGAISLIPLGWGDFFFLMKQFQLLSQGPLIQSHPKHSHLSAFSRNSESTGSCQRDNFSLLHGNLLFLERITLSPRGQVTHVRGSQLPHPCAVFTWGREHHSASCGRNCPRARGTDIFSVSLPTCNPPRWPTDPPGGQDLMAVGPAFYHTFISFWSFVLEGEAVKNILFSGLRSQAKLDKSKTLFHVYLILCVCSVYIHHWNPYAHKTHCTLLFHILLASLFLCHQNSSHINAHNITV